MTNTRPKLGAHVSAAGGLYKAIGHGEAMGAECIQIFGGSPRVWSAKVPSESDAKRFKDEQAKSGIRAVFLHAAYLVNLASNVPELRAKSVQSLVTHLQIVQAIGADGLIFHLGSTMDHKKGIERTGEGINEVLKRVPGKANLVMEISSGGGMKLGGSIEDLGAIYKAAKASRLKVCIDTAHTFAAGVVETYSPQEVKKLADDLDDAVGISNVVAFHINDSKAEAHSNVDRHENLGHGKIGLTAFKNLAKEKRFSHTAWMLEVPGMDGNGPDKANLDILKGCFG